MIGEESETSQRRKNRVTELSHIAPSDERYDVLTITLHWLVMSGVVAEATTGFLFFRLQFGTPTYNDYYYWHRSIGELVFILVGFSWIWREFRPRILEFPDVPWRKYAAKLVHVGLLVLLILVPLVKIWRDAYGIGWVFFSFKISPPLPANQVMGEILSNLHLYLAVALLSLSAVHAGAAIWHSLIQRDGLLRRMGI